MSERAGMPIQALKSIAFQYSPVEDRIRCIATPSGVSLEEPRFWLTQRLAQLTPGERATLLAAADLMLAIVDEGA